jgi:hypothetical protein
MKKNISVIFLCLLAGLFGANIEPILTGTGKLVFPETSPSASLSASGGALTVAAGGANKSILLMPTGQGSVGVQTTDPTFGALVVPSLGIANNTVPIVAGSATTKPNFELLLDGSGDWALEDYAANAWTMGLYQGNGRVGINGGPGATNQLDVGGLGTINAASGYKTANVAGLSIVKTIRNSVGTGTCTMTFSGGILTASTC